MADLPRIPHAFAGEFERAVLPKSIAAGALVFLLQLIILLSFAALIFSGPLSPLLPLGIGLLLAGSAVLTAVIALFSSFAGSIAVQQDVPSAVLAVAVASLLASMPASATAPQQFATVAVMLAGTTLLTGLFFTLLGALKLGKLVRFLPYPVMGGFLAGTGYLLTIGGLGVMMPTGASFAMLLPEQMAYWLPGLALGALMLFATERLKNPLALPLVFAAALIAFYLMALLTNTSLAQLIDGRWLLGPFPAGSQWQLPITPDTLSQVNWSAVFNQWPNLATVALVSVVALLLNASGLELVIKRDIALNRELISAGVGNVASALLGGTVGYHAISLSALSHAVSAGKRLPGLVSALLIMAIVVVGPALFGYVPRMVLAALIVFLGLGLLVEWVYRAWFRFPRVDFLIVLTILVVVMLRGFLEGVGIGLVLAIIMFLVSYSRIPVARYAISGESYHSRVQRSPHEQDVLNAHSDELYVLKLHGFIFFGTADGLFEQIRARARSTAHSPLRFVVLDMTQVSGFDSTALLSFEKMLRLAREQTMTLALAGLRGRTRAQFLRGDLQSEPTVLQMFDDLDHAVEWCENQIISAYDIARPPDTTLRDDLLRLLPDEDGVQKLIGYLERHEVAAGEYLIQQGDAADALYFVESGQVTAQLEVDGQPALRLETMRRGRTVGEIGFYLGIARTASVVANEPSVVYGLTRARLEQIERSDPEAASALHRLIVHILGERVRHMTRVIDALER